MKGNMRWIICKGIWLMFMTLNVSVLAQTGQITINRIEQMPKIPTPYEMRDWKNVAIGYDQLAFSNAMTGEHLPLIKTKPSGVNYPGLSPILLQTYVGTNSNNQAEAINIIPALVGASLMNIDKSNQGGVNWVLKAKEFFNKANGQNVYLNGYSANSGGDWWYDVMPNVFFYQLYTQYPTQTDFHVHFTTVADRWLEAVHAMGGKTTPWTVPQMNYRAWNLMTMTGNADGVKEPEAAAGIGWLLYNAYLTTGEQKYLDAAQMSIEFLSGLTSNPSYELQLPYGALVAAKMNAEIGTSYDMTKLINWTFDRGPLRGWGAITGTWNGSDVDGLIGEANDTGTDYAFALNGFQQAAALVPLIKYDKRFARSIGKWTLNLANASRLFYSKYLPQGSQDDFTWSSTFDPESTIAYEALKEKNNFNSNIPLYGTGDAKRNGWAQTNLSLYSSSSVGYLAAVVEPSDVDGILLLDVNKTDFFKTSIYPSFVIYNPHATDKLVTLQLPGGSHDIYDAISETVIAANKSGTAAVNVETDQAVLLVYIPAGSSREERNGKLYVGNEVIDYHFGYDFSAKLRIKSLAVTDTLAEFNQQVPIYAAVENVTGGATYNWYYNEDLISSAANSSFNLSVPEITGRNVLRLEIVSGVNTVTDSIIFNVVEHIPTAPVVTGITASELWYTVENQVTLTCAATDQEDATDNLTFEWIVSEGNIIADDGNTLTWKLPATPGIYEATCKVTDTDAMTRIAVKPILVKPLSTGTTPTFAYYPFDGDTKDYSGNHRDATMFGPDATADARGEAAKAYNFDSGSDIIALVNSPELNFQDKITISFWVKLTSLDEESFIISHGSWEERWKVSVTPDRHLRWTLKTTADTKDLDSSFPLELNRYYHFAVVYSGYSLELYADGELDTFSANTGQINASNKSLTMGRKDGNTTRYSLFGSLDEVRIYNAALSPDEISALKTTWNTLVTGIDETHHGVRLYPNPAHQDFYITGIPLSSIERVSVFDVNGRSVNSSTHQSDNDLGVKLQGVTSGILVVEIRLRNGVIHKKLFIH